MISVVLLTYNSMSVLPNCLKSLEQCSSASDLEVILVDNASTDGTHAWIEQYTTLRRDRPFRRIQQLLLTENRGFAFGNNRALEKATGDVLLLLNPDTIVGRDAIEVCLKSLATHDRIGAVGCRLELANGQLDRACRRSFPTVWNSFSRFIGLSIVFPRSRLLARYNLTYLSERGSYSVDCLCGAFLMVPRAVYEVVGPLDEDYFMYGEDIDWCFRIKQAGYEVWYEGSVTTVHLKGGNGGKKSQASLRQFYETMYLYYVKTQGNPPNAIGARMIKLATNILYCLHICFGGYGGRVNRS